MLEFFLFLAGMCFGSFLNVCIYRIPLEKSVAFPSSFCPGCETKIKARDLIPVISYIILKGRCRNCKSHISIQYPLVELLTGIIWLLTYFRYGLSFETVALFFLFTVLIPVAFIDLVHMIIPNGLVLVGLAGGIPVFLYHVFYRPFLLYDSTLWYAPLQGAISTAGILFIVSIIGFLIYKDDGALGMGDVKIFLPIGLFLGWKLSLVTLFIAVILAAIVGIILMIFKVMNRKSAMPLGPFIVLAAIITGLIGPYFLNII